MTNSIDLMQRLLFANMWLRLDEQDRLFVGPSEIVKTHWHLKQAVSGDKEALTALMQDCRVNHVFSGATDVNDDVRELVIVFIGEYCTLDKKAVLSGFTLSRLLYPWAHAREAVLPTLAQLYGAVDERHGRTPATDPMRDPVVMWEGLRIKPELNPITWVPKPAKAKKGKTVITDIG